MFLFLALEVPPPLPTDSVKAGNVYILLKEQINEDKHNRNLVLKNNAEDLDIVMLMYNLLGYSKNYSKTSGTLWNYYKDISTDPITDSESFKYKTSNTGKTANDGNTKDVEFSVPLIYLSNFWRTLDMTLINFKVNLILTWFENCILTDTATRDADTDTDATGATFAITNCNLYVPVVTLSAENDNKLLEQLKAGFKRTIK